MAGDDRREEATVDDIVLPSGGPLRIGVGRVNAVVNAGVSELTSVVALGMCTTGGCMTGVGIKAAVAWLANEGWRSRAASSFANADAILACSICVAESTSDIGDATTVPDTIKNDQQRGACEPAVVSSCSFPQCCSSKGGRSCFCRGGILSFRADDKSDDSSAGGNRFHQFEHWVGSSSRLI
jgi:hypothetical protein